MELSGQIYLIVLFSVVYGWIGGGIFGGVAWATKDGKKQSGLMWFLLFLSTLVWPIDLVIALVGMYKDKKKKARERAGDGYKERLEAIDGVIHVETPEEARERILREDRENLH